MNDFRGYDPSKVLTWILGVAGSLIAAGVIAMVAMMVSMGNRLTGIETTMAENRTERQKQFDNLERRVERIEGDFYRREE